MTTGGENRRQRGLRLMVCPERVEARLWLKRGPGREGEEAARKLFDVYGPFAERLARRQFGLRKVDTHELGDFTQLAYEALVHAISRFDPDRGVPFEAYARHRILGHISNGLAKFSEYASQNSYRQRIERERLRSIKPSAEALSPDPISALSELSATITMGLLLENEVGRNVDPMLDPTPSAYETLAWNEMVQQVQRQLDNLPEREAFVLRQHYRNGVSFQEIAALLGVTKGRVSQLHRAALQRIRGQMTKIDWE